MPMKVKASLDMNEVQLVEKPVRKEYSLPAKLISPFAVVQRKVGVEGINALRTVPIVMGPIPLPSDQPIRISPESIPLLKAEVIDINTAVVDASEIHPSDGKDGGVDDLVAYTAWLEAYAHFGHDRSKHRIEKHVVEGLDGRIHIKRVHVGKVYVCDLLPGDRFGDPDGRRHQAAGGYPTRSLYEERAGQSQYVRGKVALSQPHAIDQTRHLRAVTGEKQHYDGPHWTNKMSSQTGLAGFYDASRPPTFAEVLSQHWGDIARFHQLKEVTTQKDYLLKSGEIQTVIRTWKIRDASCWGHTPLISKKMRTNGKLRPPSTEALELLSSQQTDLEAVNDPRFASYGTAMSDLEVKLEVGKEQVSGYINGVHCTLGFNTDKTVYDLWLDDGTRYQWPPAAVAQETQSIEPPVVTDQVLLLPHIKTNYGFMLQFQLGERLLRDTMRRARVEWMLMENEELANRRVWRDISDTMFGTFVSTSSYRTLGVFPTGKKFDRDHETRAGEEKVWHKTVRVEGHNLPTFRNFSCQGFSNMYPHLSEDFYERWWDEAQAESEEARLCQWFLDRHWDIKERVQQERFTFTRANCTAEHYRIHGPRKPMEKVQVNYVDRIEKKVECEVVDLTVLPERFSKKAVDLSELIFRKDDVPPLVIDESDYGIDMFTGLYLPKHFNSSPKDFKDRILPPDRKKVGLIGRMRGLFESHNE